MEELSDFDLGETKVSDVENLYMDLDILDNDMAKTSRPSSTASFASWTFSPIQEDNSGLQDPQTQISTNEDLLSDTPQFYIVSNQPSNQQQALSQKTVNLTQHHVQHNKNSSSEYHVPKNVTYHHSVNIHNYVGNYCVPTPLLKDACMWEGMGQPAFPAVSNSCRHDHNQPPLLKVREQSDPITSLPAPGVEFTRCSTPEYMMALNSLHQLDSPPRPNHSAALDFSCSASFEDSTNHGNSLKQQDSGYNSDLNVSPVIQFQGNPTILEDKQKIQTSTPNPYQQFMKVPPMQLFNKENINHNHPIYVPQRYTMPMPGFQPQILCPSRQSNIMSHSIYPANVNTLDKMRSQFTYNKTDAVNNGPTLQFKSVADQHIAKKKNSQVKQKAKCETKVTHETSESVGNGTRRRHNEPLNNHALDVMSEWYQTHRENPYPTKLEKEQLAKAGGITLAQVKSWFANKRNRNNNTRPKKQKIEMEERLLELCHQLARDARRPTKDNAYYIQKLSSIIDTTKVNPGS